jgi:hypothetical protein
MMQMKNLCIVLDGVICRGKYSEKRLLCPRAFPSLEGDLAYACRARHGHEGRWA